MYYKIVEQFQIRMVVYVLVLCNHFNTRIESRPSWFNDHAHTGPEIKDLTIRTRLETSKPWFSVVYLLQLRIHI